MKKVVQNNMNVSEEIRGVIIDGQERRGIKPTGGWGSGVRIQVDNATGNIDYAERQESPQDELFKKLYLRFLEKQFEEIDSLESIAQEKAQSGPSARSKDNGDSDENASAKNGSSLDKISKPSQNDQGIISSGQPKGSNEESSDDETIPDSWA